MNTPVRVAVVGAGILGRRHARVFNEIERSELVAVVDPTLEKAQVAATGTRARSFTTIEEMLANVACDAVAVATPDHRHATPVLAALRAGRHVLVEKPLATSQADGMAMLEMAQQRGRILQVNFSQRFVQEYAFMKEQIDAGLIGRPATVISSKQDTIFVPTKMISWAASTSPIFFMSSHDIDLVCWFVGARNAAVDARAHRGVLSALGIETPDSIDALLAFDNGVTASFHSSWIMPETFPTITEDRLTIMGDRGMLHFESRDRSVACYSADGAHRELFSGPHTASEVDGRIAGAFRTSLEHFLDAVITGAEPLTSAASTMHVLDLQSAIMNAL